MNRLIVTLGIMVTAALFLYAAVDRHIQAAQAERAQQAEVAP